MKLMRESGDSWEQYRMLRDFLTAIDPLAQEPREARCHLPDALSPTLEPRARDLLLALSQCLRQALEHGWQDAVNKPEGAPARRRSPSLPPPYVLEYAGGSEDNPTMSIRSQRSRSAGASLRNHGDARLAYWLGMVCTTPPFLVTKTMVCAIYRQQTTALLPGAKIVKYADMDIQSFKRRLAQNGIDPHELVVTVRRAGWKLNPSVQLRGYRSVYPYTPGFGGAYQEGRDLLDDLPDQCLEEADDEP